MPPASLFNLLNCTLSPLQNSFQGFILVIQSSVVCLAPLLRVSQIDKAIAHLILVSFCLDLWASRMAPHVRVIPVLSWLSWTFVTWYLPVQPHVFLNSL